MNCHNSPDVLRTSYQSFLKGFEVDWKDFCVDITRFANLSNSFWKSTIVKNYQLNKSKYTLVLPKPRGMRVNNSNTMIFKTNTETSLLSCTNHYAHSCIVRANLSWSRTRAKFCQLIAVNLLFCSNLNWQNSILRSLDLKERYAHR